jgi:chemotaxis receptor (MCP) glutamine deamidase CheD
MSDALEVSANPSANVIDIFLQPGEYFVGDASYRVRTLLGSCVSITLWHLRLKIGAMSHFLLGSSARVPGAELDARYGGCRKRAKRRINGFLYLYKSGT